MQATIKKNIFDLVDSSYDAEDSSRYFNAVMLVLISLNVIVAILETEDILYSRYQTFFNLFEWISVGIFTVEYILRIWSCTEDPKYKEPILGRLRFVFSPFMLIDLAATLPFFIPMWGMDLRIIRVVRLIRLFRIMKMWRYTKSLSIIQNVVRSKKEELTITLFSGTILLILASSLLYLIEHNAQPDVFSSIPASMWWAVITLTTVGYGDIYPVTVFGKFIGASIAVLGIGLFALPAGIISSGFASELQNKSTKSHICPHCGKEIT